MEGNTKLVVCLKSEIEDFLIYILNGDVGRMKSNSYEPKI